LIHHEDDNGLFSPLYGAGDKHGGIFTAFLLLLWLWVWFLNFSDGRTGKKALGTSGQNWLADSRFLVLVILKESILCDAMDIPQKPF
jgi:hypothetical protein